MPQQLPNGAIFGATQHGQRDELTNVLSAALHSAPGKMESWLAPLADDHLRAVWQRGKVVAGLGLIHMGQWFGGARVPMTGLTAVGVTPDQRGSGIGSWLLRHTLEELHAEGIALSALYPATLPFYQRAGYMRAGQRLTYEMPLEAIDVRAQQGELVPIEAEHYAEVHRIYEQRAKRGAGNLDRPDWMWQPKLELQEGHGFRFLVVCEGQPEGYVVFIQGGRNDPLTIVDLCTLTPAAARRILALFAGYRSMVEHLVWNSGPRDPLVYLIGENLTGGIRAKVRITRPYEWMLRIIDLQHALSTRGYPPGLRAELHLNIQDHLLPHNHGHFVLQIADGQGTVEHGGQGRLTLGVGELAAIYSGFMAPDELRALGTISGPEADLTLAGAIFSGARPWISDMF